MITLAVDTATPQVSAAIGDSGSVLASFRVVTGRRHGETLAPGLEFLQRAAATPLSSVEMVAVDAGPGLFTGLRVGLATAKALASSLGVPVAPFTSLDVLAHPHAGAGRTVAAVVDARRHEVFWALYRVGAAPAASSSAPVSGPVSAPVSGPVSAPASGPVSAPASGPVSAPVSGPVSAPFAAPAMVRLSQPQVSDPAAVAGELAALGEDLLVVGDGALRYGEVFSAVSGAELAGPRWAHPGAETILAMVAAGPPETVDAVRVRPLYGRQADVRIGWEQRGA